MRTLLDERLGAFQALMDSRFAAMQASMDSRFAAMQASMDSRFAEMRADMARNTEQIIKWMAGVWIGGILLFITVMTFVLNNAIPKAPPAQPAAPPASIQTPPQTLAPAAPPKP